MLLSKIIKNRSLFTQLAVFNFSVQPSLQNNALTRQILSSKSWKEFYSIFSNNKKGFNQETFNVISRNLSLLLSKQKEKVSFLELGQVVSVIENFDASNLTEANVVSLLACLRAFCLKGFQINAIYKLKNKLCSRYTQLLIAKPQGKQNFSQIIYAYYEMAFFNWQPGSRIISQRIMIRINNEPQNSSILTLNQGTFMLNALAVKGDLNLYERRLRGYILKSLASKVDLLKMQDLVNSLISLNKMDFYDAANVEFTSVKTLGNKVLKDIADLDQKTIFQFLKGDQVNEHPIFKRIYEELIKNTYAEIQQSGKTQFDRKTMLKLISHLASRYHFYRHTEVEKKKFSNFLKNCLKQFTLYNDSQGIKDLHSSIEQLVRNHYFDHSRPSELVDIIVKSKQPVRLSLLEVLYYNKIDVKELLSGFMMNQIPNEISPLIAMKTSTILKKISRDPRYEAFVSSIQKHSTVFTQKVQEIFQSPQKFIEVFHSIFRNPNLGINFRYFHDTHEEYFQRLTNPFEGDQQNSNPQYKLLYFQYVIQSFRTKDFFKFVNSYYSKISHSLITRVVYSTIHEDSRKLQPNKYILGLVIRNMAAAFEAKQKQFLIAAIEMIGKYNRFVVSADRDFQFTKNLVKLININLNRIQILNELDLGKAFFNQFSKYIRKSIGNYKNDQNFRDILINSLRIIHKFPTYLAPDVLRQGLRLNAIFKKNIENLDITKLNSMNPQQKESLQYILDNTFTPEVKFIKSGNLQAILFNSNLVSLIQKRQTQIIQVIEKAYGNELFSYLTAFNQPNTRATSQIFTKILSQINSSALSIQRCDFQGAIKNIIEKGLNNVKGCRQLAQKIVSLLLNRMNHFSIWSHTEAIRFIIAIPSYNPLDYYKKLLQYTQKNFNDAEVEQVIFRLASTNYEFEAKDLKHIKPLLKKDLYKGTYLFLATEKLIQQAQRKEIVAEIANRLAQINAQNQSIYYIQYDYLKRAYPQETKNLNLNPELLLKNNYSVKPRQGILDFFDQLAKANETSAQILADFQQNHITKIKNVCIISFNKKRIGSQHEHQFLRRALDLHYKDQNYKFVFLGFSQIKRITQYIEKQAPQLFTPDVKQRISQHLEKNKPQKDEEQHDQTQTKAQKPQRNQKRQWKPKQKTNKLENDQ